MGIVSGGVGNTTAQVAASGKVFPVADPAGVTVDTTTYNDTIKGGGAKFTTLVFPSDQGAIAIALAGDAFPRWVFASSAQDGLYMGLGTNNPVQDGIEFSVENDGSGFVFGAPLRSTTFVAPIITTGSLRGSGGNLVLGTSGDLVGLFAHAAAAQPVLTSGTATPEQIALALQSYGAAGGS